MKKKYETNGMVRYLEHSRKHGTNEITDAIIARLRAADNLRNVAIEGIWQPGSGKLREAIANYDG